MTRRKPRWWRIFVTAYAAAFACLAAVTPDAFSAGGIVSVALLSLLVAIACQMAFHLLWPVWASIAERMYAEGGWKAAVRSIGKVRWTGVLAVVLTSKLFFLASCTGGMVLARQVVDGVSSGTRGDHVRPLDKRMAVIAMVPDAARSGERKTVEVALHDLGKFKQDNPGYSFMPPVGKGELSGPGPSIRTEFSVSAAGPGKVMVETTYHNDEHHVLARYSATDKEVEPLFTKTNYDFADFMTGMIFGVPFAFVLALLGYFLKWWLKRMEVAEVATESRL